MEKHIHKYLSSEYFVKASNVGNDGIYSINDTNIYHFPVYGSKLIKELILLFYVDELMITKFINSWAVSQKPDVNLDWYWEQKETLMPIAMKVMAQTVGLDLVAVVPMESPKIDLLYMDFAYSGETPNRNGRIYDSEVFRQQVAELANNQHYMMTGELDHPDLPMALGSAIGVSSRKSEEIERQSWFNKKTEE
jgi:hypothetical protein